MINLVFFGSFQNYSVSVLDMLFHHPSFNILGVVTTPPAPSGRHLVLTPNPIQTYCVQNTIPVFPIVDLSHIPTSLPRPDFLVVAGYGKLIPDIWLNFPQIAPLNLHQSLLPKYPGRFPAEWAILNGETNTGVTLIKMSAKFDQGEIYSQAKVPISDTDTRETLYAKLYRTGADLIIQSLPKIATGELKSYPQPPSKHFYARQLTRNDGFLPWTKFIKFDFDRKFRAFYPWPGIWSINPSGKRIKLLALKPKIIIQEEGKTLNLTPTSHNSLGPSSSHS